MAARRTWKPDEKLAVVLAMLQGQEPVAALCHRHAVGLAQAYRWRDAFLERGQLGLKDQRNPTHRDPVQEENRRLRELAGAQALIIDAQKKLAGLPECRPSGGW